MRDGFDNAAPQAGTSSQGAAFRHTHNNTSQRVFADASVNLFLLALPVLGAQQLLLDLACATFR